MRRNFMIFVTIVLVAINISANGHESSSECPSYDTTYVDKRGNEYRQIYVNGQDEETYILIRNDSIIIHDVEKKRK